MFGIATYTNEALVQAISTGGREEEKALSYLIRKEFGKIRTFILLRNGSEMDAEDVFQEGLTALILNVRKEVFKGESAVSTYLFAICKGIWFKRFQKIVREQEHRQNLTIVEDDPETPEISLLDAEQRQLLWQLFDQLREKCREVLFLWASSYSMGEIATQLDYGNAQVAMNKKNKCLKQLHQLMEERPEVQQLIREL